MLKRVEKDDAERKPADAPWNPNGAAMRRMRLANDLLVENMLSRRETLARTGYGSWQSLLGAARTYRKRMGLPPVLRHATGWIKVGSTPHGGGRIVLCADAIKSARWRKGERVAWRAVEGEIWLRPFDRLTPESAHWKADDPDAEVYWQHYGNRIPWRAIAVARNVSMATARRMGARHAAKYPWIPFGERPGGEPRGIATVMRVGKRTLRLNLHRAARLAGLEPADLVRWEVREHRVLVLFKHALTNAQACK